MSSSRSRDLPAKPGVTRHPYHGLYKPTVPVPPDTLTPDEERYALALFVAEGNRSQNDVYMELFPKARLRKPNTVWAASSLLAKKVSLRVKQLQDAVASPKIADAVRRQEFWTETMLDENQEINARLRASELLGKKQGDFEAEKPRGDTYNDNRTLVLGGFTVEQLRELLGKMG